MANKSLFLVLLLVAPLVALAQPSCSPVPFTRYGLTICVPGGLEYFPSDSTASIIPRTLPAGWMASWKISSGMLSSQPVWTNEETDAPVVGSAINFGLSQCLNTTRKAVAVSGGCVCDVNNDLVLSKPAFLNITDATVGSCGIGAVRQGVRPVPCNSWLCGCVVPDRAAVGVDAAAVVSQVYCN